LRAQRNFYLKCWFAGTVSAENRGEDYFPLKRQTDGKWVPTIYTTKSLTHEQQITYESVIEKITANMYYVDRLFDFQLNLKDKSLKMISEFLQRDQVATIFFG